MQTAHCVVVSPQQQPFYTSVEWGTVCKQWVSCGWNAHLK